MAFEYYYMKIMDRAGVQKIWISSAPDNALLGGSFVNHKLGGCGEMKFRLHRDKIQGTISARYLVEFGAKYDGGSEVAYYVGTITELPIITTTDEVWEFTAQGLFYEAQRQHIVKYYETDDVDNIVIDILSDIQANCAISSSTSEISIASPYAMGDFEPEYMNASAAIKLLAEIQGNVEYGVGPDQKLYFRDEVNSVIEYLHIGKHVVDFEYFYDAGEIINRYYMQSKKLVGGGALTLTKSDSTSISNYGLNTKVIQIPHISNIDDVWRWATKMLLETRNPQNIADVKTKSFYKYLWPSGKATITTANGSTSSLFIQAVKYSFDGTGGLRGDLILGDREDITFSKEIESLMREIRINQSNAIGITRIEHTRSEEFRQDSITDGQVLGLLSHWDWLGQDLKSFDADNSYHMWLYQPHQALCCPFDKTYARYRTNAIPARPTGEDIDTVRLHIDVDFYGRMGFEIDEDLNDDWWTNKAGWQIYDGKARAYNIDGGAGAHPNDFMYYNQSITWPTYHKIRFGLTDQTLNAGVGCYYYYNYIDTNNYVRIVFVNSAANCTFTWQKMVAGVGPTNISNYVGVKDIDYWLEIYSAPPAATATVKIYRSSDDTLLSTLSNANVPSPGGTLMAGPDEWHNTMGNPPFALLDWNEWDLNVIAATAIDLRISRDGGTTWTAAAVVHGENHITVDLSGQPSGNTIIIRADTNHPCRIYGLGVSF